MNAIKNETHSALRGGMQFKENDMAQETRAQRMDKKRADALREAVKLFLTQGYHQTTLEQIAKAINSSTASLLRAYPDKEAILYALVSHMLGAQFANTRSLLGENADPLLVYAVETALQMNICELSEPLRDLYVTAYTLPTTSEYIYHNTSKELMGIFSQYLTEATESDFYELEIASGSVMRGYMAKECDIYFPIERKFSLFLSACCKIYDVPKEKYQPVIDAVLAMDIKTMAMRIVEDTVRLSESGFSPEVLAAVVNRE